MSSTFPNATMTDVVVDEVFPHRAATIWKALTSGALMARWLMPPTGFEPVEGCHFTFQTTAAGAWDGVVHCEVLDVRPNERFAYSWKGGHEGNVGYGSKLDTVVTWTLSEETGGTRLRLVQSGFRLPANENALRTLGDGWKKVVSRLRAALDEPADPIPVPSTPTEGQST